MSKNNKSMTTEQKDLTPEEESKAQEAPKEEDVRENIISEYGFDETDDADTIDKLVTKEMEHTSKLSQAIGQKIKQRDKVGDLEDKLKELTPEPKTEETKKEVPDDLDKKVDDRVTESLEKRDLDNLEYSDELKDEIKRVSQTRNISVKEALRDPYIVFKAEEEQKEDKADEASISNKSNKRGGKKVFSLDSPPDVDMNTEEGRKEYDEWKVQMIKEGN